MATPRDVDDEGEDETTVGSTVHHYVIVDGDGRPVSAHRLIDLSRGTRLAQFFDLDGRDWEEEGPDQRRALIAAIDVGRLTKVDEATMTRVLLDLIGDATP